MCGLLRLASFLHCNVFKVHPCCTMYSVVPFMAPYYPVVWFCHICGSVGLSGRLHCFHLLAVMNNAVINTVCTLLWEFVCVARNTVVGHVVTLYLII